MLVQPGPVSARLREALPERGRNDSRGYERDRGWHQPRQDRGDHHRAPPGALPVDSGATHLHREEGNDDDEASAGVADMVGPAAARSDPPAVRGVLRAAVLRPLPRVPPRPRVPYRLAGDISPVARDSVVHRGRHHRLFGCMVTLLLLIVMIRTAGLGVWEALYVGLSMRPVRVMTARSSPRFTRCNMVWREMPRARVAWWMATQPSGVSSVSMPRNCSVSRM